MGKLPKRKYIRLAPEVYANPHEIFFLTIDALERGQYFTVPEPKFVTKGARFSLSLLESV
jgi:hypothetical protein